MSKYFKLSLVIVASLLCGKYLLFKLMYGHTGLKVCPDELIIMTVAGPDRSGATEDGFVFEETEGGDQSFYILDGKKKAIQEFDTAWVAIHCKIPITNQ